MSVCRVVLLTAGVAAVGLIGYAASKSETVKKATRATIKAGYQAKDWAEEKLSKTKEVKDPIQPAKA